MANGVSREGYVDRPGSIMFTAAGGVGVDECTCRTPALTRKQLGILLAVGKRPESLNDFPAGFEHRSPREEWSLTLQDACIDS